MWFSLILNTHVQQYRMDEEYESSQKVVTNTEMAWHRRGKITQRPRWGFVSSKERLTHVYLSSTHLYMFINHFTTYQAHKSNKYYYYYSDLIIIIIKILILLLFYFHHIVINNITHLFICLNEINEELDGNLAFVGKMKQWQDSLGTV